MKKHLSFIFLLLIFLGGSICVCGQEEAIVYRHFNGFVKDSDGNPIGGARVCGWDKSNRPINGRFPCDTSRQDGGFSLNIRKWDGDTYYIFVEDEAKGYPNPNSALYESIFREKQIIDVEAADEAKSLEIKLGQKAGKAVLKIFYDDSGKPVESGQIKMCRTDTPEICQSISTAFLKGVIEILTPNSPVTLKIELHDGTKWREWLATDENKLPIETIHVEAGQTKEFKIRIRQ